MITDSTGAKVQTVTYYPFGGTRTNQSPSTPAIDVPYKYTGKELDSTGLYYYEARYYDPILARFISADTIVPNPRDLQSLNRYSYVENNPLRYVDPSGHSIVGVVVGAIIGAVVGGIQSDWDLKATLIGGVAGGVSAGVMSGVSSAVSSAISSTVGAKAGGLIGGIAGSALGNANASLVYQLAGYNSNILRSMGSGALSAYFSGVTGMSFAGGDSFEKIFARGISGGIVSAIQGREFGHGFGTSFASAMMSEAYAGMKAETDRLKILSSGASAMMAIDSNGDIWTYGERGVAYGAAYSGSIFGHMANESAGPAWWMSSTVGIDVFLNGVSKVHDVFMEFGGSYDMSNGHYADKGFIGNSAFDIYSFGTMPLAAGVAALGMDGGAVTSSLAGAGFSRSSRR